MLSKLDCFLDFWNAAACGTIPAARPDSNGEVPPRSTMPVWVSRGMFAPPLGKWHCRLCFICLWALMPLAVAGEARCSAVGSCALTIAVLCLPWRLNRDRSFSCNLLLTAVTGKRGCMSGSYSRKKDYWDLMPSSSKQLEEGSNVTWSYLRKCESNVECIDCPNSL